VSLDTRNVVRRGLPDKFVEHGERNELLADCGLSVEALVELVRSSRTDEVAKCG
jgi:1-deoxy-D-xylulose-5-phosphate synthase